MRGLGLLAAGLAGAVLATMAAAAPRPVARPAVTPEPAVNLSASPGVASARPQVALTADGTVHVLWEEGEDIRHVFRRPGGSWGPNPPLTVYYGGFDPALATFKDLMAVAFVVPAGTGTDTAIRLKLWDGQSRWQRAQSVHADGEFGQQPDLAFQPDDGSVWLAWVNNTYGYRPYYSRVLGTQYSSGPIARDSQKAQGPSIGVDAEGGVWVAWKEEAQPTGDTWITCRRSASGAPSWGLCSPRTDVLRGETFEAYAPDLAVGAGSCITWHNGTRAGRTDVYLACDAAGWSSRNVSQSPLRNSLVPRLALERLWGPLVTWEERDQPRQVLVRPGLSPAGAVAQGDVAAPAVAFEPRAGDGYGYAHLVWEQVDPADPEGEPDIYYRRVRVDVPTPTPTPSATATATPTPSASAIATASPLTGTTTPVTATTTPDARRVFAPFVFKPVPRP
jgi:hypothetical protein